MLNAAKDLLSPSRRSDVPPFIVMDVMAAAAAREAKGERVVHMEVGQPAAPAPLSARRAAQARSRPAASATPNHSGCRRCARESPGTTATPTASISTPAGSR